MRTAKLIFIFLFFAKSNFSQITLNVKKNIIEKYFWKGSTCSNKTNMLKKLTLEIYSDSTYILKPVECRELYNTKKEWKAHKNWFANGIYKTINEQRYFYQNNNEAGLMQQNSYITYKEIRLLKIK